MKLVPLCFTRLFNTNLGNIKHDTQNTYNGWSLMVTLSPFCPSGPPSPSLPFLPGGPGGPSPPGGPTIPRSPYMVARNSCLIVSAHNQGCPWNIHVRVCAYTKSRVELQ